MLTRPNKDIVEIFGYQPDDLSHTCRSLWDLEACPFVNKKCSKTNHDQSIVYGTCSVTSPYGDIVVCPNRLYEEGYSALRRVAEDAFGKGVKFFTYEQYIPKRTTERDCVVALGQSSGKEVKLGKSLSMDWVLARVRNGKLAQYVGIEVQSIDITGNYRDCWHGYKRLTPETTSVPSSGHGLNWANVHKRLIPQLIRKGLVYSKSNIVPAGLYFVVPEIVYQKFEELIGADIPQLAENSNQTMTVHTYSLSEKVKHGERRNIVLERKIRFNLDEFSRRFTSGSNLPSGMDLDRAVGKVLGVELEQA